MILTADWHLDDETKNEYRWDIFPTLHKVMQETGDSKLYVLGDLTEKKDKHSSNLVNRLVSEISKFKQAVMIAGNHDKPLNGPAYWQWLSNLPSVNYYTDPHVDGDLLLLPNTRNPSEDWKRINYTRINAVFMHQHLKGVTEKGRLIKGGSSYTFPDRIKVYSGDIHTPQTLRNVTYVGAPHPVRFGDNHKCRVLWLHDDYSYRREICLEPIRKPILEVSSIEELKQCNILPGHQARIRFTVSNSEVGNWNKKEEEINRWASDNKVFVESVEAVLETDATVELENLNESPEDMLRVFAASEGMAEHAVDFALNLVKRFKQ